MVAENFPNMGRDLDIKFMKLIGHQSKPKKKAQPKSEMKQGILQLTIKNIYQILRDYYEQLLPTNWIIQKNNNTFLGTIYQD